MATKSEQPKITSLGEALAAEEAREARSAPEPAKRRARSKEERAAALLAEAKIDKAIKGARQQLDVIRRKLYERDFDGAVAMAKLLFEQLQAELPFNAKAEEGGEGG